MRYDGKLRKFEYRSNESIFIRYSCTRKTYKCYNLSLNKIVESINVRVDGAIPCSEEKEEHEENEV